MLNKFAKGLRSFFVYGAILSFILNELRTYAQEISFIESEACACGVRFIEPETTHCTKLCESYGPLGSSRSLRLVLPMKYSIPAALDKNNAFTPPDLATYVKATSPYNSNKLLNAKLSYFPSTSDKLKESYFYLNFKIVENNFVIVDLAPSISPKFTLSFIETVTGRTSANKIKFDLTNYFQEKFISSGNLFQIDQFHVIYSQYVARFTFDYQRGESVADPLLSKSFYFNHLTPYANTTYEVYRSDIFLQSHSPGWQPDEKQKHSLELFRKNFPKLENDDSTSPHLNKKYVFTAFSENHSYILPAALDQIKEEPWSNLTVTEAFISFSLPLFFYLPKHFQPNRELSSNSEVKEQNNNSAYFFPMGLLLKSSEGKCPSNELSILNGSQILNFKFHYIFFAKPVKSQLASYEVISLEQLRGGAYFYQGKKKIFIEDFSKYKKQKLYYANSTEEFQLLPSEGCGLYQVKK